MQRPRPADCAKQSQLPPGRQGRDGLATRARPIVQFTGLSAVNGEPIVKNKPNSCWKARPEPVPAKRAAGDPIRGKGRLHHACMADCAKRSQFRGRGPCTTICDDRGRSGYCAKQSQMWGRWGIWVGDGRMSHVRRGPTLRNKANWLWRTRPGRPRHEPGSRPCETKPIPGRREGVALRIAD